MRSRDLDRLAETGASRERALSRRPGGFAVTKKDIIEEDKIVPQKEILVDSTINWETLKIEVLYCASTPPSEIPEDYVLINVYDTINEENINIYTGWMISSSPDVTPLENPIYDLWLLDCNIDKTS